VRELLTRALMGHEDAVQLCMDFFQWANCYDHVIDRDVAGADLDDAVHTAMWIIAVDFPRNPFYREHAQELSVTTANAIQTWRASVDLERTGGRKEIELSHVLRWVPTEFFLHCARIVGGKRWADEIAGEFWLRMTEDHTFDEYRASLVARRQGD